MRWNTKLSKHQQGLVLMLGSVISFATNALLIQGVVQYFPAANAWVSLFFRSVLGLVLVYGFYRNGRGLDLKRLFRGRLIFTRGIIGAVCTIAFYITVVEIGAARAVVLNLTYPIFGTIIAAIWLKEKITQSALAWMLLGFLGLTLFISGKAESFRPNLYDLMALLGAMGSGWIIVIIRRLRDEEHHSTIYASLTFYGLILTSPIVFHIPELPKMAWFLLSIAATIATIGQLFMTKAYHFLTISQGSSLQMLLPIITALGGFIFFEQGFHRYEMLGAALTLLATWRISLSR